MDGDSTDFDVKLDVQEADEITKVFIGYETADGTEFIIASAEPPASVKLSGISESDEES